MTGRVRLPISPLSYPLVLDRAWDPSREGKRRLVDLCVRYEVLDVGPLHTADGDVLATLDLLDALARAYPDLAGLGPVALHYLQVVAHTTQFVLQIPRPHPQLPRRARRCGT